MRSNHTVDVIVHIDEDLPQEQITRLEHALGGDRGIRDAQVNRRHHHLMRVDYAPSEITARQVLSYVQSRGYHAELVGFL